ncbi:hypothetical protein SAMN04487976_11927 [Xaviernesmea oryzae]|nr:hypothetical protein SAMN04487976_11927 [Xaviernesmea oryzae]
MVPNPIFTAANLRQRQWTVNRIGDNGEIAQIDSQRILAVLQTKGSGKRCEIAAHNTDRTAHSLIQSVLVKFGIERVDLRLNSGYTQPKPIVFCNYPNIIEIITDATGNARLLRKLILLYS